MYFQIHKKYSWWIFIVSSFVTFNVKSNRNQIIHYTPFQLLFYFASLILLMNTIFYESNEEYPTINLKKQENVFFFQGSYILHNSEKNNSAIISAI